MTGRDTRPLRTIGRQLRDVVGTLIDAQAHWHAHDPAACDDRLREAEAQIASLRVRLGVTRMGSTEDPPP